jgi:bifunctional DNA-binding transcriptional regulator/antitoxin component of YhaV-PrlF toxin-antitoxin module
VRHGYGVTTIVQLDASNRIVLPRELRRAAGVPRGQKLRASATPGRIVLEVEPASRGKVIKRGKLKLWSGDVPSTPLAEAIETTRHYEQ